MQAGFRRVSPVLRARLQAEAADRTPTSLQANAIRCKCKAENCKCEPGNRESLDGGFRDYVEVLTANKITVPLGAGINLLQAAQFLCRLTGSRIQPDWCPAIEAAIQTAVPSVGCDAAKPRQVLTSPQLT